MVTDYFFRRGGRSTVSWGRCLLVLFVLALPACVTSEDGGYVSNRLRDLTDVAHLDGTSFALGALVNVGPARLGYYDVGGLAVGGIGFGSGHSTGFRCMIGLGGIKYSMGDEHTAGLVIPISRHMAESAKGYASSYPTWGSVGFDIGFLTGFGAHVDFVEFVDFVIGLSGYDILGDDIAKEPDRAPPADSAMVPGHILLRGTPTCYAS